MSQGGQDTSALEAVLARAADVSQLDVRAKLQLLEDAAAAAEALDLGAEGRDGALHLRAALGAIVRWSQGADRSRGEHVSAESVAQLEVLVRTLMARGLVGLYRALAQAYDALVVERAPHRAACIEVRDAFREAARAVERGEPIAPATSERLARAKAALA